jgi:hypothetical protein
MAGVADQSGPLAVLQEFSKVPAEVKTTSNPKQTVKARTQQQQTFKKGIAIMKSILNRGQSISDPEAVVAVYKTHPEAEVAVKELQKGGFEMKKLSIVGKDYHTDEQVVGYYNAGDRMKYWGRMGALWGGFWGLLFGAAFFWVPGVGPLLIAGPLSASIVAALEGGVVVGGLSALGAGLYSIGIPKDSIVRYENAIKVSQYLLVAHGTEAEVAQAKEILKKTNPAQLDEHEMGAATPALAS